jgi:hypothetical protein
MVIVESELPVGMLVPVQITGSMPYDLSGVPAKSIANSSGLVQVQ